MKFQINDFIENWERCEWFEGCDRAFQFEVPRKYDSELDKNFIGGSCFCRKHMMQVIDIFNGVAKNPFENAGFTKIENKDEMECENCDFMKVIHILKATDIKLFARDVAKTKFNLIFYHPKIKNIFNIFYKNAEL